MAVKPPITSVVLGNNYDTNQIYSTGVEFAMAGRIEKKWQQATTFVFCKDFLHDAVWAMLHKKPVGIYDFRYNPGGKAGWPEPKNKHSDAWYEWCDATQEGTQKLDIDPPVHMRRAALLFRDTNLKGVVGSRRFHAHREGCLDFLRKVDKQMGFRASEIMKVKSAKNSPPTWLVLGDRRWLFAPTLVSLYSMLIRVGYYHNVGGNFMRTLEMMKEGELGVRGDPDDMYCDSSDAAGCNDAAYIKQAWKGIEVILKHGLDVFHPEMIDNYPDDIATSILHDHYGIVNFTKRRPEKRMPHWYRKTLWK